MQSFLISNLGPPCTRKKTVPKKTPVLGGFCFVFCSRILSSPLVLIQQPSPANVFIWLAMGHVWIIFNTNQINFYHLCKGSHGGTCFHGWDSPLVGLSARLRNSHIEDSHKTCVEDESLPRADPSNFLLWVRWVGSIIRKGVFPHYH